jgi:sugar/nucleoside kinase (ribokinase family)
MRGAANAEQTSPQVEVVSPLGAGDAFMGALAAGLAGSRREAERLIAGGGVKLGGVAVDDVRAAWSAKDEVVLSVGTRRFVRILRPKGT